MRDVAARRAFSASGPRVAKLTPVLPEHGTVPIDGCASETAAPWRPGGVMGGGGGVGLWLGLWLWRGGGTAWGSRRSSPANVQPSGYPSGSGPGAWIGVREQSG